MSFGLEERAQPEGNMNKQHLKRVAALLLISGFALRSDGENGWGANVWIELGVTIKPTRVLTDFTKLIGAGDTTERRFGNAFVVADFNGDGRQDVAINIHGPDENDRSFAVRTYL